jgi:2-polyprenyl-6-methoxyphenol hydroxylase-like FAD-dependent oxidoreductase
MMGADVVIVGAGPVGLWTAIQLKKRRPNLDVQLYERHEEYQRSHVLRLKHLSMLLYGKNSLDPHEQAFHVEVTGKNLAKLFQSVAGSVFIRTNDLEQALKTYAQALGVRVAYERVDSPQSLMEEHSGCKIFVAADGAHSRMRAALLGDEAVRDYPLQYVAEIKYQANGPAGQLDFFNDQYKANKLLSHMAFEYVGREKEGVTPVTLRFFVDRKIYDSLPDASFKNPVMLGDQRIPVRLVKDINTYMNVRAARAGEQYREGSGKLTKLALSLYAAKRFAVTENDRSWFLVGDAAMGVPYFRALNSGIIVGSQLGFILTRDYLSDANKARIYNAVRPLNIGWEFTAARFKDLGLMAYDQFRQASAEVPWEVMTLDPQTEHECRTENHQAFCPKDKPQP